jgi:hypothetical protein
LYMDFLPFISPFTFGIVHSLYLCWYTFIYIYDLIVLSRHAAPFTQSEYFGFSEHSNIESNRKCSHPMTVLAAPTFESHMTVLAVPILRNSEQ